VVLTSSPRRLMSRSHWREVVLTSSPRRLMSRSHYRAVVLTSCHMIDNVLAKSNLLASEKSVW